MKILLASTPATGHFNPILAAARLLGTAGHETAIYTSVIFRDRVEGAGVRFFPLPEEADKLPRDLLANYLERNRVTPGTGGIVGIQTDFFVNPMIPQFRGLEEILESFPAEAVIHETAFAGVLPLLLGPRPWRPLSVCLSISALTLERADGAPWGPGLLPTDDPKTRDEYREVARAQNEARDLPVRRAADRILAGLGLPPLPAPFFRSTALLADLILQPCTPGFEFPLLEPGERLRFIGALMPSGAGEVPEEIAQARRDGRKIILVSQGTVANNDLGKLLAPAIRGLGEREDLLILVTTGGRPIGEIPCTLAPNTVASHFLDFARTLPDVDVLVAFASYGTVTQALKFGVPMVVVGKGEDKPEVGARVTWTGAGIYLATDTPSADEVRDAVNQVLRSPAYRAGAGRLAREFAAYDPGRELPVAMEELVRGTEVVGD